MIKFNNFYSLELTRAIQKIFVENDPSPDKKFKYSKKSLLLLLFNPKLVKDLAKQRKARKQAWKFYNQLRIEVLQDIRQRAEYSYYTPYETAFRQDMNYSTWRVGQWLVNKDELFYFPSSVQNHDEEFFFYDTHLVNGISAMINQAVIDESSPQKEDHSSKSNKKNIIIATTLSLGLFLIINELIKEYQDNTINHSYFRLATLITLIVVAEAVAAASLFYLPMLIGLTISTGGLAVAFAFAAYAAFSFAAIFGTVSAKILFDCHTPDRYELSDNEKTAILTKNQNVEGNQIEIRLHEKEIKKYGYTFFWTDANKAVNEAKTAVYSLRNG